MFLGQIKGKTTFSLSKEHLLCLRLNGALAPFVRYECQNSGKELGSKMTKTNLD
jgi:hypothetical protein